VQYSNLGAICGVIPLRKRAERYLGFASELTKQLGMPTVDAKVSLLSGLYWTSIGEWQKAKSLFEPALGQALRLGDTRRWSELAVSLETIISPWFLNPAYGGKQHWGELVDKICHTARASGDPQVLGSGLTGAVRGYHVLGMETRAQTYLDELSPLVREQSLALEPIHWLEGAAYLADAALDRGDIAAWQHWLEQAALSMKAVSPTIKTRTLPALSAAFRAAMRQPGLDESVVTRDIRLKLATASVANLARFARIYPIGRPRAALFRGDIEAYQGNAARAAKFWRRAFADALLLNMPADALASLARLRAAGLSLVEPDLSAMQRLDVSLLDRDSEFRKTAELAAAALSTGGGGAVA
jgi:hypothetical protein